jgi:hypothetical protein
MADKQRSEAISAIKDHLVRAKAIAEKANLPKLAYRGIDVGKLHLDERMIDVLKYIGNGCPNIYYMDDWGMRILPEYRVAVATQLDQLISAMEMAGIQEEIGSIAPEVAAKIHRK